MCTANRTVGDHQYELRIVHTRILEDNCVLREEILARLSTQSRFVSDEMRFQTVLEFFLNGRFSTILPFQPIGPRVISVCSQISKGGQCFVLEDKVSKWMMKRN